MCVTQKLILMKFTSMRGQYPSLRLSIPQLPKAKEGDLFVKTSLKEYSSTVLCSRACLR